MIDPVGSQADKGCKEARGGTGVAYIDPGFAHGNFAAAAFDTDDQRGFVRFDLEAKLPERGDHDACVAAKKRAAESDGPPAERRENERAVGDTLGTG